MSDDINHYTDSENLYRLLKATGVIVINGNDNFDISKLSILIDCGYTPQSSHENVAIKVISRIKNFERVGLLAHVVDVNIDFRNYVNDFMYSFNLGITELKSEKKDNVDILWHGNFNDKDLNDNQKLALVFLREVGALDNNSYRQLTGANRSEAGIDLRDLRKKALIDQKNTGKATYYLPTNLLLSTMVDKVPTMVDKVPTMVDKDFINEIEKNIPKRIRDLISNLGKRSHNQELMEEAIWELCEWRELSISELAGILNRNEKYIKTNYIQPLIVKEKITYTIPEMLTHPNQKYKTLKS